MATFTSEATGDFTSNVVWGKAAGSVEGTNYPGPDDDIVLGATYVVTLDLTTAPSTGTYNSISGNGQLSIVMGADDVTLSATTLTGGAVGTGGTIALSGDAPTKTFTFNGNTVGSASGSNTRALVKTSTCIMVVNGSVTGGNTVGNSFGFVINGAGAVTITGNVTGGSYTSCYGISVTAAGAPTTIGGDVTGGSGFLASGYTSNQGVQTWSVGGNLIDGTGAPPYQAKPPTWTPSATNYHQTSAGKLALEVAAADLKDGVFNGTVEGTLVAGYTVNGVACA